MAAAANESDAGKWCTANLTGDDAKILIPLFEKNGVASVSDVLLLSKEDLTEMGVAIGPRNRIIAAQAKAKPAPAPAPTAPVAPVAPVTKVPVKVPYAANAKWNCVACTAENQASNSQCDICGTNNPNAPPKRPVGVKKEKAVAPRTAAALSGPVHLLSHSEVPRAAHLMTEMPIMHPPPNPHHGMSEVPAVFHAPPAHYNPQPHHMSEVPYMPPTANAMPQPPGVFSSKMG